MRLDELIKYTNMNNDDNLIDNDVKRVRLIDAEAKVLIMQLCNCGSVGAFRKINPEERNGYIKTLCDQGISIRQLSRLTGMSKTTLGRICEA